MARWIISTTLAAIALSSPAMTPAAMPSGWIYVSRAATSQPPVEATALCNDGSWSFEHQRHGACPRQGGVASWLGERSGQLAQTAGDPNRAVR